MWFLFGTRDFPSLRFWREARFFPSAISPLRDGTYEIEKANAFRGTTVIRQAISCDICGTEKQLTNHWFVAYDQSGELRVGGWNSRNRQRPGARHLCGQTCLHKLIDEYLARTMDDRTPSAPRDAPVGAGPEPPRTSPARIETGRASIAAISSLHSGGSDSLEEVESSARLLTPAEAANARLLKTVQPGELSKGMEAGAAGQMKHSLEGPGYAIRTARTDAWKRERERQQQGASSSAGESVKERNIA